jgi:hypothetical protein
MSFTTQRVCHFIFGILLITSLVACKKNLPLDSKENVTQENKTALKILDWIDFKSTISSGNSPLRIKLLKEALDFNNLIQSNLFNGEKIIIVPINEAYKSENGTSKKSSKYLLLFQNKNDSIRKGTVVLYSPEKTMSQVNYPTTFL